MDDARDEDELNFEATQVDATSRRISANSTPYSRLRQLAGAIHKPTTPLRGTYTPNARATSGRRAVQHTPASQRVTPGLNRPPRPVHAKQPKPTTPHAIRALQQRKAAAAALTPGRERRRSGRQQRETPRDILRQLSRLEKQSVKISPAAIPTEATHPQGATDFGDSDSEPDEPRPNLTLPLDDEDDDDSFQAPPRLSRALEEENDTQVSIEGPRRDFIGLGRRPSLGVRMSDGFGDPSDLDEQGRAAAEPTEDSLNVDNYDSIDEDDLRGDETGDLRAMLASDRSGLPRVSLGDPNEGESSFAFRLPPELADAAQSEDRSDDGSDEDPLPGNFKTTDISVRTAKPSKGKAKVLNQSRYGIPYPALPAGVVKKLTAAALKSAGNSKTRVNHQILAAVLQASDWFFEQLGEDLEAYADHAKRKTVDESDVVMLMKRQRILTASATPFSVAQKQLPRELLQDLRMAQPSKFIRKRRALDPIAEESD